MKSQSQPIYKIYTSKSTETIEEHPRTHIDNAINRYEIKKRHLLAKINEVFPEYTYEELFRLLRNLTDTEESTIKAVKEKNHKDYFIYQIIKNVTGCEDFTVDKRPKKKYFEQQISYKLSSWLYPPLTDKNKINYSALYPQVAGVCELWGRRDSQEDYIVCGMLNNEVQLSSDDWIEILNKTVADLQKKTENENNDLNLYYAQDMGSTLNANIIMGNRIINANLGDSETFLVTVKNDGSVITKRLHSLHKPSDLGEGLRIRTAGGTVRRRDDTTIYDVVHPDEMRGISVSGAIGDNSYNVERELITRKPNISVIDVDMNEGQHFLVTACDGLREGLEKIEDFSVEASIGKVVARFKDKPDSSVEIAEWLALKSYKAGSTDNISVIVAPITNDSARPKFTAVFDGHCGHLVSEMLSHDFETTLNNNFEKQLKAENEKISNILAELKEYKRIRKADEQDCWYRFTHSWSREKYSYQSKMDLVKDVSAWLKSKGQIAITEDKLDALQDGRLGDIFAKIKKTSFYKRQALVFQDEESAKQVVKAIRMKKSI